MNYRTVKQPIGQFYYKKSICLYDVTQFATSALLSGEIAQMEGV
jgi:hypothetical protein